MQGASILVASNLVCPVLIPEPENGILFGKRFFTEVIKAKTLR